MRKDKQMRELQQRIESADAREYLSVMSDGLYICVLKNELSALRY